MTLTHETRHAQDMADMMEALLRAQAILRTLPERADEIAALLLELGVRGHVGDGEPTALEMYLRKATGWDVDVHDDTAEWGTSSWQFTLRLPERAIHFGWNYRAGDYEALLGYPTGGRTTEITDEELPGLAPLEV